MAEKKKEKSFWSKMTFTEKCQYLWNNITVEPLLAGFVMPSMLTNLATQNLNLEKACRVNLDYNSTICDALSLRDTNNYTFEEKEVQRLVAGMSGYRTAIQSGLPCLMVLFWGSWSDRHQRRKPCILFPLMGELLAACGLLLCVYLERTPVEFAVFMEVIFPGLTGGWYTMFMGIYSYLAHITTEEERTLRIGIVSLCFQIGVPLGTSVSGILLKKIGFYGVYSISIALYSLTMIYGIFFVKEVPFKEENRQPIDKDKSVIGDFFDREHIYNTFRIAFVNGANRRRIKVIMLMIVVMVVIGPLIGESSVFYLFTRYRFNWSEVEFSLFCTYSVILSTIGTFISVGILSTVFKIEDPIIGVLSSMSKILSSFVYAFAYYEWHMYVAALVDTLNGTSFISMRAIASKLVTSDELGKVNSLFGAAESLAPMLYAPLYATVYAATLTYLPGAFFLLGGAMTLPAVVIFLWLYKVGTDEQQEKKTQKKNSVEDNAYSVEVPPIAIIEIAATGTHNIPS